MFFPRPRAANSSSRTASSNRPQGENIKRRRTSAQPTATIVAEDAKKRTVRNRQTKHGRSGNICEAKRPFGHVPPSAEGCVHVRPVVKNAKHQGLRGQAGENEEIPAQPSTLPRKEGIEVLIETFIRKQLGLKAHTVTKVEETERYMVIHIDRLGSRGGSWPGR